MHHSVVASIAIGVGIAAAAAGAVRLLAIVLHYAFDRLALWPYERRSSVLHTERRTWPAAFAVLAGTALALLADTPNVPHDEPHAPLISAYIARSFGMQAAAQRSGFVVVPGLDHFDEAQSCVQSEKECEAHFKRDLDRYQESIDELSQQSQSVLVVLVGSYDYRALSSTAAAIHHENPHLARERAGCFVRWLEQRLSKETLKKVRFFEMERAGIARAGSAESELAADRSVTMIALPFGVAHD